MAERYEFPAGHHMVKLFPVEGDSALAELWFHEAPWAQIELEGIELDELGEARIANVSIKISLFPPPPDADPAWWEFELPEVQGQLEAAKSWLLENERGRSPIAGDEGPTAAGRAMEKLSDEADSPLSDPPG